MIRLIFRAVLLGAVAFLLGYAGGTAFFKHTRGKTPTLENLSIELPSAPHIERVPAKRLLKIAILDTGIDRARAKKMDLPICKDGHYNFITQTAEWGTDYYGPGHGTQMAAAAHSRIQGEGYCFMVLTLPFRSNPYQDPGEIVGKMIVYAVKHGANIINMSFTGTGYSHPEHFAMKYASDRRVMMFVAAGNDKINLDDGCIRYPACYTKVKNKRVVGALDPESRGIAHYSNRGKVIDIWMNGSFGGGRGTSYSAAFATGGYANSLLNSRRR